MKKIISLIVCAFMLTACGGKGYQTVDSNKVVELMEDGAVLIDVRTGQEFASGYIDGAINVPVETISTIEYDKDTVIIVYCASGMRSTNASETLVDLGYTNVYNLDGGLINWGFELVTIAEE